MTSPAKKVKATVETVVETTAPIGHNSNEANTTTKPALTLLFNLVDLFKGEKAILARLAAVMKTATEAQREYQLVALSAIQHSLTSGDITIIQKIIAEFPEGMRKDSLSAYFDKYACVDFVQRKTLEATNILYLAEGTKGAEEFVPIYSRIKRDNMLKNGWFEAAATNWWYKATKQTEYKGFSFLDALDNLIRQAEKKLNKPNEQDDVTAQEVAEMKLVRDRLFRAKTSEEATITVAA